MFSLVFLIATEYLTKKLYFYIQMCNKTGTKWNYGEWLFTSKPGVFGMIGGCANPTGVALISILTIMVLCSLPCVRRSGRFEVSPFRIWVFFVLGMSSSDLLIWRNLEFWSTNICFLFFLTEKIDLLLVQQKTLTNQTLFFSV